MPCPSFSSSSFTLACPTHISIRPHFIKRHLTWLTFTPLSNYPIPQALSFSPLVHITAHYQPKICSTILRQQRRKWSLWLARSFRWKHSLHWPPKETERTKVMVLERESERESCVSVSRWLFNESVWMELNFIEASSTLHRALVCTTRVLVAFYIFFNSRSACATRSFFFFFFFGTQFL